MKTQYTDQARTAIMYAEKTARRCRHNYIGTEHLLAGLIHEEQGTAGMVLREFGVGEEKLMELIDKLIAPAQGVLTADKRGYTPRAELVLKNSRQEAMDLKSTRVGTEHLLLAMLKEVDCVGTRLLHTMGVSIQKLQMEILVAMGEETSGKEAYGKKNSRGSISMGTPTLDQYSRDLTELARQGKLDPVVGREEEIARIIQILSRRTKNNPCLVGEPGVGKTAIAEGLAQRIVQEMVPDTIKGKRVVVLDLSGMVAGSKYRGEFEERIKRVVSEVMEHQGILLFIDELHTIIGAGGAEGALDASNI
ncbi:MAG: Clp protease N-terminal domain-containing protein, partial [Oliverpabstia sp.]|nr:Clp protease N-terminal domain-containing protein [Oliverpabstia sp.]